MEGCQTLSVPACFIPKPRKIIAAIAVDVAAAVTAAASAVAAVVAAAIGG